MGSNSPLPLTNCVTLGKCLTTSGTLFPYGKHGRRYFPPRWWRELNQLRCGMGTQWALNTCPQLLLTLLLLLLPGSIQEVLRTPVVSPVPLLGGTVGSPSLLQASEVGLCPQRHSGRLAPHKAGAGGQPRAASANGHQLDWWLGRAGSCLERAGLAVPPLPTPGTGPASLRFLRPPEGAGRPG